MATQNRKNNKMLFLFLALLLGGIALGVLHIVHGMRVVVTDDAYIEGRVHSIAAKIPGTIKAVAVEDNQKVKKGDLLCRIDPVDYEFKLQEARAALEAERSRLLNAEAEIKVAQATVEMQKAVFDQAALDKQRAEALYKDNVIPKERIEKTETAYSLAKAQQQAAQEQLAKAMSSKALEASLIKQREAALGIAELNVGYTNIYAPSDGYVTRKAVEVGNQIQAGQPLMAIVALDDIWIVANYKETQLKNVRPGQPVTIKVDTYPGTVFRGRVDSIMAGSGAAFSLFPPENALGNYVKVVQRIPVKIVLDAGTDPRHVLRIGMSCEPSIDITHEKR